MPRFDGLPPLKLCVPTLCIVLHMIEPGHLQGNIIYPCGYTGGAKDRVSAVASFESAAVSLSSADGIAQIEMDKEFQAQNADKCLQVGGGCGGCVLSSNSRKATGEVTTVCKCVQLSGILSDEAMDHVKKMCGPGYTIQNGKPVPIEPEVMKILVSV